MKVLIEPSDRGLTVTIPREIAEASQMQPGTEVDIRASAGQIVLSAAPALTLDELLEGMTPSLDPQTGREQRGRRPALILTPRKYNRASGLALACPITSQVKGYRFETFIPPGLPVRGAILSASTTRPTGRQNTVDRIQNTAAKRR